MEQNRPTKKQQELLQFVDAFITEHGYGPSYREVMRALNYKSVSTVASHVDGLIAKGYLSRRDNSARSLEVVSKISSAAAPIARDLQHELSEYIAKRSLSDEQRNVIEQALTILELNIAVPQPKEDQDE